MDLNPELLLSAIDRLCVGLVVQCMFQCRVHNLNSPFKEAVLFLITIPTSSGAVVRFLLQAGNVSKKQHKLLNQMRRLAFMVRFNLDVEGRLV